MAATFGCFNEVFSCIFFSSLKEMLATLSVCFQFIAYSLALFDVVGSTRTFVEVLLNNFNTVTLCWSLKLLQL
jgi:hypothetical protein